MYRFYKRNKYIEEYDGDKVIGIWRILKRYVVEPDDDYNYKICYCEGDRWFKVTYYTPYEYEITICDEDIIEEFGILCKPN